MNQGMPGPYTPEQMDAMRAYWEGAPGQNSSSAATPPPDPMAYYAPAPLPPAGPPSPPPPPSMSVDPMVSTPPAPGAPQPSPPLEPAGPPPPPSAWSGPDPIAAFRSGLPPGQQNEGAAPVPYGQNDTSKYFDAGTPTPKAAPKGGGGPGDFGAGKHRNALYNTFDQEGRNIQQLADVEAAKNDAMAAGMGVIGRDRVREADKRALEAQHQEQIFAAYQEETQRQLDEVRQKKVQPNRLYQDSGSKVIALIGGMLGGMYQGMNKLDHNDFIDQMNRNIDRDIGLQEREIDGDKKNVQERKTLLGEMRATYKDNDFAKAQAKNLYYEGIKEQLLAEAATYDSPAIMARAKQGVTMVERQQEGLKLQEAAQKAAQAAAGAAMQRAEARHQEEMALKRYEAETHRISAEKEKGGGEGHTLASRFVGTGQDAAGNPTGYLERDAANAAKREEARIAAKRLIANIDRVQSIRDEEGTFGRATNTGAAGLYSPEWKTQLKSIHGEMLTDWGQAKGLKALSESDYKLAHGVLGEDFNGVFSATDERLNELRRTVQRSLEQEDQAASGARVVKMPDESIVPLGGSNAPRNAVGSTGVRRER